MKFNFFGYQITVSREEADELEQAKKVLERHGFRAVRKTQDKSRKRAAAAAATEARERRAREAVCVAIEQLKISGEKVTVSSVAREANVSRVTAKKYMEECEV
jgi:response regulator of citrate/malate metabolism